MDEGELQKRYGERLKRLFGPDFVNHEGYKTIVEEVQTGRYAHHAISEREQGTGTTAKVGW